MKNPRKRYRPKPISTIGGIGAIDRRHKIESMRIPIDGEQLTDLGVAYRMAYQQMTDGHATEENWCTVVTSLNIALVLAERCFDGQYAAEINKALEGAFRARVRALKCGSWGLDGQAMQDIKKVFDIHEAQMEMVTKLEIIGALDEVKKRIVTGNVYREAA